MNCDESFIHVYMYMEASLDIFFENDGWNVYISKYQ